MVKWERQARLFKQDQLQQEKDLELAFRKKMQE